MWTRSEIKEDAKGFLRNYYWKAFVVCLIVALFSGGNSTNMNNNTSRDSYEDQYTNETMIIFDNQDYEIRNQDNRLWSPFGGWRGLPVPIMILSIILIIIQDILEVGRSRFFLQGFRRDVRIGNLFSVFKYEEIFVIIITQFLRRLYNSLWYLLLIIPGIIKSYEYRFVPYILAEESYLSPNEIITKSREITDGHKFEIFVLDLSFMGWYLLGALLCGVGIFLVNPYIEATDAKLYNVLMGNDGDSPLLV